MNNNSCARSSRAWSTAGRDSVALVLSLSMLAIGAGPTWAAGDTTAPSAVKGMKTSTSTSRVKLDWASGKESDLAGYHVYRADSAEGEYTRLTESPRRSSDYTDKAAPAGTTSYYRVVAVDKAGNESAPVAASGVRKDRTKPLAVTELTGVRTGAGVALEWADSTEADLAGYVVSRATSSGGKYVKLTGTPVTDSAFVDGAAAEGTAYWYRVGAVDRSGNTSSTSRVAVVPPDVSAPQPVSKLRASTSSSRVKLDWSSSKEPDLAGYLVYRSDSAEGEYTRLTESPRRSSDYYDHAAPAGLPAYYRVTAVDRSGNESPAVSATGTRTDRVKPLAVTGLTGVRAEAGVALEWADNAEADLAGYVVSRATSSGGKYTKLTETPVGPSAFVDGTAAGGTAYWYRVSAVDRSGNASATAGVAVAPKDTTAPAAVADLAARASGSGVALDWADSDEADLAGYVISRATSPDGAYTELTAEPVQGSAFEDTTAAEGTAYSYRVSAVDTAGNASTAAGTTFTPADTTAPGVPTDLTATGTVADVALEWADSTEEDLAGYHVYRSGNADGEYSKLTEELLTSSDFADTTAPAGATSHYRVTAVDAAGNESAPASADGTRAVEKAPVAGADLTVAQDGSGDHATVAEALAAAPANSTEPFVIAIKPGTYREVLLVDKPRVVLSGSGADAADVVISYDNAAGTKKADGTAYGTTGSATVTIKANDVTTKNLTIENSYVETGTGSEQAVALKTIGDRLVFDTVRLLGDQDTLYADSPRPGATARSYWVNSYVEGDVDFVFGRGTAVFDRSTLMASTRGSSSNNGYLTAASTDKSLAHGFLITDSTVLSDAPANSFHLGRPWQPSGDVNAVAQVVIRNTELPAAIKTSPWTDMSATFSWRDARLFEYRNTGAGAAVNADRPQLNDLEAAKHTKWAYLAGTDGWNPTGETAPPPPADTTAPEAPAGLAAEAGDSNVALSWTANGEDDLAGYHLYRSTSGDVALTAANRLTDAPLTGTAHTDRTAANGTEYHYVLTAVDRTGNESVASASLSAAPVGVPLPAHDLLVAADGTGQFASVQAAVDAAPAGTAAKPTVIAVKPGVYKELVTLSKSHVTVIGTTGSAQDVVLTYDNAAGTPVPGGTGTYGTGKSQSVLVSGSNVTVRDLTIENSFDEAAHTLSGEQAVALKTTGDRLVFDNVRVLGNQDTLLVDSPDAPKIARSYFVDSYIEGDVDFIFGRGTAVFRNSQIHALSRGSSSNNGYITAASTSDHNPHGFLIIDSTITSDAPAGTFSLGRPWRGWSDGYTKNGAVYNSRGQVTVRDTELPAAIRAAQPWTDMSPNLWTDGRFFEYANTGPGATVNDNRPQFTDDQAAAATPEAYLAGTDGWNPLG